MPESGNLLFGRTLNPWNETRSSGGSSGGEAGLVCAKCTPVGYGYKIWFYF